MATDYAHPPADSLIVHVVATYKSLRRLLVGVALTFLVLLLAYRYFGHDDVSRHSISAYYHNQGRVFGLVPVRDLFVGSFSAVALMLYAYEGFTPWESKLLNIAVVGLLVVAACPMEWAQPAVVAVDVALALDQNQKRAEFVAGAPIPESATKRAEALRDAIGTSAGQARALAKEAGDAGTQDHLPQTLTGWAHYLGVFAFFIGIALVCWFHATATLWSIEERSRRKADTQRRRKYQRLYGLTGTLMALVPVLAVGLYLGGLRSAVFWVEFAGVAVFILYWSIKSWELSSLELHVDGEAPRTIEGA
jgi:hypothetical protein